MNTHVISIATLTALLLGACSTLIQPRNVGSVVDATVTELRLCFRATAAPTAGQEVQILRRQLVGSGKPPATYLMRKVGTARVTAPASDRCVPATLITGTARPHDEARWSDKETPR